MHWLLTGKLSVEKLTVNIPGLPASLQGTRLVQMSDFHYDGLRLSEELLATAIATCNRIQPDLIVLTGDYVTDDPAPINQLVLRLKYLQSRLGIYAVLGNHDIHYSHSRTEITNALTRVGIQVLWNEIAYPLGKQLPLVGLADYWSGNFKPADVMNQLDTKTPRIVLSHNPDTAKILQRKKWRVDLQLSGHTHGGHIVVPYFGSVATIYQNLLQQIPRNLQSRMPFTKSEVFNVVKNWQWAKGFHRVGSNKLYVNRGLGTYFPGRFCCRPEITLITLATY
ncbi:metallophosphoesterase [Mastigocoleus sp. MO_188.B34]|uniref:metallophosphoesterase n=1 Tax=Mastigocoleus sp. MO_188.B34 TaxID=3036635 RepID=UPI00261A60C0|nr:metallophosphoesterase [Mastigocoleus sp. MO_188.B34]MDJ0698086.1 metallophosphoesterase [Mastigocoleus sp. MO_188.B34]